MKNSFLVLLVVSLSLFLLENFALAQTPFLDALQTCSSYTQEGHIENSGKLYNISISLKKTKNGCQYKEKITHFDKTNLLTCNFSQAQTEYIVNSMKKFYSVFKNEIAKNKIFEAKLTTNGEIFQEILVNRNYCTIEELKK